MSALPRRESSPTQAEPVSRPSHPVQGARAPDIHHEIERTFREESGRIVATLMRVFGDFDVAEEGLQEAFATAVERWPRDGVPHNPGAWITTAARASAPRRRTHRRGSLHQSHAARRIIRHPTVLAIRRCPCS